MLAIMDLRASLTALIQAGSTSVWGRELLNGAEPPVAMDVGAIGGAWGPDFAELGRQFLAHPKACGANGD